MIVITMTTCPIRLRGDLTKWLQEIDTGVFAGNISARVREELWDRIANNAGNGHVTMAYSTKNAQGYAIRTLNTVWSPAEYDGLTLMLHPLPPEKVRKKQKKCKRHEAGNLKRTEKKHQEAHQLQPIAERYVVIDLETTGLSADENDIIEIAALKVRNHRVTEQFISLIKHSGDLPKEITALTGITDEMLRDEGKNPADVMPMFISFIGKDPLVIHNAKFDLAFVQKLCQRLNISAPLNDYKDTLQLSRRLIHEVDNYRLATLANLFGIDIARAHRALSDGMITMQLFEKLNEISGNTL